MKYSAKGKTGFVFVAFGVLGFPAGLISGNMPFPSLLFGCIFWAGLGALLVYYDKKGGGKKEKTPKTQPKPVSAHSESIPTPAQQKPSTLSVHSPWYQWENEHESLEQLKRIRRAQAKEFICRNVDVDTGEAVFLGRDGETYVTTLSSCTCPDFEKRGLPCKHMYYLASSMRLIYFEHYLK